MPRYLLPLLLLLPTPALSEPFSLTILLSSHHVNATIPFNETNPGLILTYSPAESPLAYSIGTYLNSYSRQTTAAFIHYELFHGLEAVAGLAHYPIDGRSFPISIGDTIPLIGLRVQLGPVSILALPSDGIYTDAILAFGYTLEF